MSAKGIDLAIRVYMVFYSIVVFCTYVLISGRQTLVRQSACGCRPRAPLRHLHSGALCDVCEAKIRTGMFY